MEPAVQPAVRSSLVSRAIRAALLRVEAYEEVEHDEGATGQAAVVVGIVALATALGHLGGGGGAAGVILGVVQAYLGWALWAGITDLVGSKVFGGTATTGELLRTLGFAQVPGVLRALAFLPALGPWVELVSFVWLLLAGIVAIRQALDIDTGQALTTAFLAWLVYVGVSFLLATLFGGTVILGDPIG